MQENKRASNSRIINQRMSQNIAHYEKIIAGNTHFSQTALDFNVLNSPNKEVWVNKLD